MIDTHMVFGGFAFTLSFPCLLEKLYLQNYLSEEIKEELKSSVKEFKSWNIFIEHLLMLFKKSKDKSYDEKKQDM